MRFLLIFGGCACDEGTWRTRGPADGEVSYPKKPLAALVDLVSVGRYEPAGEIEALPWRSLIRAKKISPSATPVW